MSVSWSFWRWCSIRFPPAQAANVRANLTTGLGRQVCLSPFCGLSKGESPVYLGCSAFQGGAAELCSGQLYFGSRGTESTNLSGQLRVVDPASSFSRGSGSFGVDAAGASQQRSVTLQLSSWMLLSCFSDDMKHQRRQHLARHWQCAGWRNGVFLEDCLAVSISLRIFS